VTRERLAEITVPVPADKDLQAVIGLLEKLATPNDLLVTALEGDNAVVTLRVWADDEASAQRLESELRLRAHQRLREAGVYA